MREKIGCLMEALGVPLIFAGVIMFIWNPDIRIALTLSVCAVFSIFGGALLARDL